MTMRTGAISSSRLRRFARPGQTGQHHNPDQPENAHRPALCIPGPIPEPSGRAYHRCPRGSTNRARIRSCRRRSGWARGYRDNLLAGSSSGIQGLRARCGEEDAWRMAASRAASGSDRDHARRAAGPGTPQLRAALLQGVVREVLAALRYPFQEEVYDLDDEHLLRWLHQLGA